MPSSKNEPKTKPNDASAVDYLTTRAPENRRADGLALLDLHTEITGHQPVMWGEAIIGFDRYTSINSKKEASDWPLAGFSPRKSQMTVYLMAGFIARPDLLEGLGKFKTSVACLYFNKLSDLDLDKLRTLISWSYEAAKLRYKA